MSDRHRHRENLITAYNLAREDLLDGVADMEGTAALQRDFYAVGSDLFTAVEGRPPALRFSSSAD
jgi:hypothetical protein